MDRVLKTYYEVKSSMHIPKRRPTHHRKKWAIRKATPPPNQKAFWQATSSVYNCRGIRRVHRSRSRNRKGLSQRL